MSDLRETEDESESEAENEGEEEASESIPPSPKEAAPPPAKPEVKATRVETWREMLKEVYFTFDRRTLALTRICLGYYLLGDLFRRTGDWFNMFGPKGVLPTELILTHPQANGFSLLHGFVQPWELCVLWAVIFVTYVCVLIGYKTKVAQVVSLLFVTSMNGRVLLIENGGYVVENLLLLWTCFMPLGDRFSLDAMQASWKRKREKTVYDLNDRTDMLEPWRMKPFVSLIGLVLLIQLSAVYYFNKLHKTGPAWSFTKAEAVHYVMYVDRMVNPIIADVRTHIPFFVYKIMTRAVLFSEMFLAFFFLVSILPDKLVVRKRTAVESVLQVGASLFFAWVVLHCPGHRDPQGTFVFFSDLNPKYWQGWEQFIAPLPILLVFAPEIWTGFKSILPAPIREVVEILFGIVSSLIQKVWGRRIALVIVNFLHIGFGSTFVLGPFAWALCVFSTLLFQREDWEITIRASRRTHRERTVIYDDTSGAAFWFCRIVKRLDRYDLLAFDVADDTERPHGIVVEREDGTQVTGAQAFSEIFAAFPVGAAFAWIFTTPGIVGITSWCMQRGRWTRLFKLEVGSNLPEKDPTAAPVYAIWKWTKFGFREVLIGVMFLACINQALTELWVTKTRWSEYIAEKNKEPWVKDPWVVNGWTVKNGWVLSTQPEIAQTLIHKMRFLQGWFMFSPNPVMDDGTIVVDAVTVDGRHVDPFWNTPPNKDLIHAKSFGYNQIWSDYFNRIHIAGNRQYRDAMVDYMRRLPERTHNPKDAIVSGEVFWVHDMNPKWMTTDSYGEGLDLMFTFDKEGGAHEPPAKKPDGV